MILKRKGLLDYSRIVVGCILLCFTLSSKAQETSYRDQLLALESELDSLSIFNLINEILEQEVQRSDLSVRFAYTSALTNMGRDYNVSQAGISPGISYYHKNGFFGDLTGYWNSQLEPNYSSTILTAGYLKSLSSKWSYTVDYERWFYNAQDTSTNISLNALGANLNYDFKWGFASVDYSYLFEGNTAHRLLFNLTGDLKLKPFWIFKTIRLYPSASVAIGNGNLTTSTITRQQLRQEQRQNITLIERLSDLDEDERVILIQRIRDAYQSGTITQEQAAIYTDALLFSQALTDEQLNELITLRDAGITTYDFADSEAFGLLNYSFSIPLALHTNRLSFLLSYTYTIPVPFKGETFPLESVGYFGASVSFRIDLKTRQF